MGPKIPKNFGIFGPTLMEGKKALVIHLLKGAGPRGRVKDRQLKNHSFIA